MFGELPSYATREQWLAVVFGRPHFDTAFKAEHHRSQAFPVRLRVRHPALHLVSSLPLVACVCVVPDSLVMLAHSLCHGELKPLATPQARLYCRTGNALLHLPLVPYSLNPIVIVWLRHRVSLAIVLTTASSLRCCRAYPYADGEQLLAPASAGLRVVPTIGFAGEAKRW
jgi:hypothetical protein